MFDTKNKDVTTITRRLYDGLSPLRRDNAKEGQSEWYYIDPTNRPDSWSIFDEQNTIDVNGPDEPNPKLYSIVHNDIQKHPEKYYVWQNNDDESPYPERQGQIFRHDYEPEGGHPDGITARSLPLPKIDDDYSIVFSGDDVSLAPDYTFNGVGFERKPFVREKDFGDKLSEFMVTNPISRGVGMGLQGLANSATNPFGYAARAMGVDTKPLQAQNAAERAIEKATGYGYDAAVASVVGLGAKSAGLLGQGVGKASRIAQGILAPELATATTGAMGGGTLEGWLNPETAWGSFAANTLGGMAVSANPVRLLTSTGLTRNMQGGLDNVISNPKAMNVVEKGIKYGSDDLTQEVINNAQPMAQQINNESAGAINNALTARIDVPQTLSTQNAKYAKLVRDNVDKEVVDFLPTREQIINYPAQSKFNLPKKKLNAQKAQKILQNKAEQHGIEIGGHMDHYINKRDRAQYVRTLDNTLKHPDIKYSMTVENSKGEMVDRDYFAKKYNEVSEEGVVPVFDFIVEENGKLYTKFKPDELEYIYTQLKKITHKTCPCGKSSTVRSRHVVKLRPIFMIIYH